MFESKAISDVLDLLVSIQKLIFHIGHDRGHCPYSNSKSQKPCVRVCVLGYRQTHMFEILSFACVRVQHIFMSMSAVVHQKSDRGNINLTQHNMFAFQSTDQK